MTILATNRSYIDYGTWDPDAKYPLTSLPNITYVPVVDSGGGKWAMTNGQAPAGGAPGIDASWTAFGGNVTKALTPAIVATTANITLSGEQTIDGVLTSTTRVLVKNQTLSQNNGAYITASGAWTRATDADTWAELVDATIQVVEGSTQAGFIYTSNAVAGGTLGTTPLAFTHTGTVSSIATAIFGGAIHQLLVQSGASATTFIPTANSEVLVTNSSGVPGWSATLPAVNGAALTGITAAQVGADAVGAAAAAQTAAEGYTDTSIAGLNLGTASTLSSGTSAGDVVQYSGTNIITASLTGVASGNAIGTVETFTPTDGSGATLTFTNIVTHFYKVDKLVMFNCKLTYPSTSNGNQASIVGLPEGAVGSSGEKNPIPVITSAAIVGITTPIVAYVPGGTTQINFANPNGNGLTVTNALLSGITLDINGHYLTA